LVHCRKPLVGLAFFVLFLFPAFQAAGEPQASPPAAEPAQFPYRGLITGSGVNLRSGPGRSYEILLQLARGTQLRVLERRQSWFAVALPEGVPAYLHRSYVGKEEQGWAPVQGSRVQVRVRPSDGATSWGDLSSPERVRVLGSYADWVKIQPPPFCRGWVSAEYVVFLQNEQGSPGGTSS